MSFADQLRTIFTSNQPGANTAYATNIIFSGVYDTVRNQCISLSRGNTGPPLNLPIAQARSFTLDTTATVAAVSAVTVISPAVLPTPSEPGYPYVPMPGTYVATPADLEKIRDMLIEKLTLAENALTVVKSGAVNITISW